MVDAVSAPKSISTDAVTAVAEENAVTLATPSVAPWTILNIVWLTIPELKIAALAVRVIVPVVALGVIVIADTFLSLYGTFNKLLMLVNST